MAKDRSAAQQGIASLLGKLSDPDPDIRFMQLNDLATILNAPASEYIKTDSHTAAKLIDAALKALTDQNGEVQNQALRCIGPLGVRLPNEYNSPFLDKITDLTTKDIDTSVPNTALRTLVSSFPRPQSGASDKDIREAYHAISRVLIPRLLGFQPLANFKSTGYTGLMQRQSDGSYSNDAVDVLIEVIKCYGSMLLDAELTGMANALMTTIRATDANGVVKKRAMTALGALAPYFSEAKIDGFMSQFVEVVSAEGQPINNRKYLISTIGTLARSIPRKAGLYLPQMLPPVLGVLSQEELDGANSDDENEVDPEVEELREAALVAVEALIISCPDEMQPHLDAVLDSTVRFLKYDPNVAELDDEEMGGTQDNESDDGITEDAQDDDDEYAELDDDAAFSDVDDMSWKVRRCAAKAMLAITNSGSMANYEQLFAKASPVLISRLNNEREDNVRLEVISSATALIQKASSNPSTRPNIYGKEPADANSMVNSRKRRREDSDGAIMDNDLQGLIHTRASPPIEVAISPAGAEADLATIIPKIVQAVVRLWKKASMSLKQSAIVMLRVIALSRNGALADHLQQLEDPVADALKPSVHGSSGAGAGSSATIASLRIEALALISTITETNGNRVLIPFVIALIPSVTSIVRDRNFKVSVETLGTLEQFVKALTPPRFPAVQNDNAIHVQKLHSVIVEPVLEVNTDVEVRHRAIRVLGVLLARTSATNLLPQSTRVKSLGILSDRLKNETTRLESARAISLIAEAAKPQDNMGSQWVQDVSLEMANQLRKSDRALRVSCLEALQYLALNPVTASLLDTKTIEQLQSLLMPLISPDDLNLLTPALVIFARIIPTNPETLMTGEVVRSLCLLSQAKLEGPPLKAYLLVVKIVGEQGAGQSLMKGLLAMGTDGETSVLGRAIGTLMVYGGSDTGVSIADFLKEAKDSTDVRAQCLALAVLGEVGFRTGSSSSLGLDVFIDSLSAKSERVRLSAAMALGSASSSNISTAMPILLGGLGTAAGQDILYLHALKEILQHSESAAVDIAPYASDLWTKLFTVADTADTKAIGAECIGRLAVIEPSTYVPELSRSLDSDTASVRSTVISAFRFALSDAHTRYDANLIRTSTDMIQKMLTDSDLANRREAIITLNAAIHSKPELVVPYLGQVLPLTLTDSYVKPELVKSVKIGPFTHQEDAGLEVRKAAYGTLYALLDTPRAIPQLPVSAIVDRIVDGISDDHDIRTLCHLMLSRLIVIDASECRRRLSPLAEKFKTVLGTKIKDNAVKQEIEKVNEANAAVIRATIELERAFPIASTGDVAGEYMVWKGYLEYVKKEFAGVVRGIISENDR